jgi:thiosulfate/3-mercaptopyruvate sulfurtransferase
MRNQSHPLISPEELAGRIGEAGLIVLDATFTLPNQGRNARQEFEAGHLPGARFFDIDAIADLDSSLPHMLPSPQFFSVEVSKLGISNDSEVIVYDGNQFMASARALWMFRVFGHERVRVLDGGIHHWRQLGLPVTTELPLIESGRFNAGFKPHLVKDFQDIQTLSEQGTTQIVDARPEGRFLGVDPEPRPGLRSGHIPGSRNLFFKHLLDPGTHRFLAPERLEGIYRDAGALPDQPIVATCGSGVTAAILALGLALIGHRDTPIYDGSWSEWGQPGSHPVAKG